MTYTTNPDFKDVERESTWIRLGDYPWLCAHLVNISSANKAPCPVGCDEDGECSPNCKGCAGFGYTVDNPDQLVQVVACAGRRGTDWAVYAETPGAHRVLQTNVEPTLERAIHYHGLKLIQKEAERVFPSWAIRLAWRK